MLTAKETVDKIVKILDSKKAKDIVALKVDTLTTITDYFVILTGGSSTQVQSLADNLEEELLKEGIHAKNREGYNTAEWILLGFNDVIVHIFKQETREFYNLEHIWKDAENVDLSHIVTEN
ncbi:MAG: ribosome silencing factor [Clostridia bacterium]|nr:ribosome silencing factor [Clostridia bacterium]